MPIFCGPLAWAPLIANLRSHFAEFLNHRSPERLRILFLPTCVSFSTVNLALTFRSFSWTPFHTLRDLKCSRDPVLVYAWRIYQSRRLIRTNGHFCSYRCVSGCRPSITSQGRRRNINLPSIVYALRPRLRYRLTLGGFTLPRKP